MKKNVILALSLLFAVGFTSCKAKESSFKEAYEKAQEKPVTTTTTTDTDVAVEEVVTKPVATNTGGVVQKERVTVVESGDANKLYAYNVVVGSFTNKTNATALMESLKVEGYNAFLAQNEKGMYRVIAASFDNREAASTGRNALKSRFAPRFNDAWLLINE